MVLPLPEVHWRYEPADITGAVLSSAARSLEVPGAIVGAPVLAPALATLPYRNGLAFGAADLVTAPIVFAGPVPPAYTLVPAGDFSIAVAGVAPAAFGAGGGTTGGNIIAGLGIKTAATAEMGAWLEVNAAGALEFWIGDGVGAPSILAIPGVLAVNMPFCAVATWTAGTGTQDLYLFAPGATAATVVPGIVPAFDAAGLFQAAASHTFEAARFWNSSVMDARLWTGVALSAAEADEYHRPGKPITTTHGPDMFMGEILEEVRTVPVTTTHGPDMFMGEILLEQRTVPVTTTHGPDLFVGEIVEGPYVDAQVPLGNVPCVSDTTAATFTVNSLLPATFVLGSAIVSVSIAGAVPVVVYTGSAFQAGWTANSNLVGPTVGPFEEEYDFTVLPDSGSWGSAVGVEFFVTGEDSSAQALINGNWEFCTLSTEGPPFLTAVDPLAGAVNVPVDTLIALTADDDLAGVVVGTIQLTVEELGVFGPLSAIVNGVIVAPFNGPGALGPTVSGSGLGFDYTLDYTGVFQLGSTVEVNLTYLEDALGNSGSGLYQFMTVEPPAEGTAFIANEEG